MIVSIIHETIEIRGHYRLFPVKSHNIPKLQKPKRIQYVVPKDFIWQQLPSEIQLKLASGKAAAEKVVFIIFASRFFLLALKKILWLTSSYVHVLFQICVAGPCWRLEAIFTFGSCVIEENERRKRRRIISVELFYAIILVWTISLFSFEVWISTLTGALNYTPFLHTPCEWWFLFMCFLMLYIYSIKLFIYIYIYIYFVVQKVSMN